MTTISGLYAATHQRLVDLAATATEADLDTMVPATPAWRVRDVYAHLTGVVSDVMDRRTEGAASDAWTQRQVDSRADRSLQEILQEWDEVVPRFCALLDKVGEERVDPRPIVDVWAHEQDVRACLHQPGGWDDGTARWYVTRAHRFFAGLAGKHDLRIEIADTTTVFGSGDARGSLHVSAPELVRGHLGRRSMGQLRQWDWRGEVDVDAVVPDLLMFGISDVEIHDAR